MEHRNFSCTSQLFDMDLNQNQRHLHPEARMHFGGANVAENVSCIFSMENETSGLNFISRSNFSSRLNEHSLSIPGQEMPLYRATSSSSSYGPYCPNPPNYEPHRLYNDCNRAVPLTDSGRGPYKRKSPAISLAYERGSSGRYYGAGSSSDRSVSSGFRSLEEPTAGSRYVTWDRTVIAPHNHRGRGLSIGGEGYQRNVRSRSGTSSLYPEANLAEIHLPTNPSRYFHSMGCPIEHIRNGDLVVPSFSTTMRERSNPSLLSGPHGGILTSDNSGLNRDSNQFVADRNINDTSGETGGYQVPVPSRNSSVTWQNFHAFGAQPTRGGQSSYAQRYTPAYRPILNHPHAGYSGSSSEGGLQPGSEAYISSRYSRAARNGDRAVRSLGRISFDRSRLLSVETDSRDRLLSEGMLLDRSAFYGSGNLLDQHRDMRLDIDNMSYEELLALEERIGNVNTGLSEEMVSSCLKTKTYCSSSDECNEKMEEETCIVCQEEYKNKEEVGILNCGHDYHADCIKKWLVIKNVCPICKAPAAALPDGSSN